MWNILVDYKKTRWHGKRRCNFCKRSPQRFQISARGCASKSSPVLFFAALNRQNSGLKISGIGVWMQFWSKAKIDTVIGHSCPQLWVTVYGHSCTSPWQLWQLLQFWSLMLIATVVNASSAQFMVTGSYSNGNWWVFIYRPMKITFISEFSCGELLLNLILILWYFSQMLLMFSFNKCLYDQDLQKLASVWETR